MRQPNPKVEVASGAYDVQKDEARQDGKPHTITLRMVERQFGLRPQQLKNYRANYYSRRDRQ